MKTIQHKFVDFIPDDPDEGIVFVSIKYKTSVHKCACGCGNKVVTPLTPDDWKLTFDGKTISLYPSIGNWNFPCQSHYFITRNHIRHVRKWSRWEIEFNREKHTKEE